MEIYSSWSYPLDMVLQMEIYIMPLYLLGNAGAWPRLQAMFQQRWRLLAAVLWPYFHGRNQRDFWEVAARNQQTV